MSKVFSAKRKKVEFEYEFLDGKKIGVSVISLSSKQQEEIMKLHESSSENIVDNFKKIIEKQLSRNNEDDVRKIINEQYEEGDLIDFSNSLSSLIVEEKEKK